MLLSERLKEETHQAHIAVENLVVPRIKNLQTNHSYFHLLGIFYGYYQPLESKIQQEIDKNIIEDISERRKAEMILNDIDFIGERNNIALCFDLPTIETPAQALGALYVLEGSTLGGKFLSKMIADKLRFTDDRATTFFDGYGSATGKKWYLFKTGLNNFTTDLAIADKVVASANETFIKFKNWIELN